MAGPDLLGRLREGSGHPVLGYPSMGWGVTFRAGSMRRVTGVRSLLIAAAVLTSPFAAAPVPAADLSISFAELTRLLQSIAGATRIYLNNVPGGMFADRKSVV